MKCGMAEQQQQQQHEQEEGMRSPDTPVPGGSPTGKALSLARLLQYECSRLLQLYTEHETFLSEQPTEGRRMVSLSPSLEEADPEEAVRRLHAALRQCLGLLHCAITRAEEEWGELEGDFETQRDTVRIRLEHLLHTTKHLLQTDDATLEVTPDIRCDEVEPLHMHFTGNRWRRGRFPAQNVDASRTAGVGPLGRSCRAGAARPPHASGRNAGCLKRQMNSLHTNHRHPLIPTRGFGQWWFHYTTPLHSLFYFQPSIIMLYFD
ncbi:uncharacterized protein LOC144035200 isoform X1 [Vanacampus margaritifer]